MAPFTVRDFRCAHRCRPDDHDVLRARSASLAPLRRAGFRAVVRDDRALGSSGKPRGWSRSHVAPARWSSPPALVLFAQGKEAGVTAALSPFVWAGIFASAQRHTRRGCAVRVRSAFFIKGGPLRVLAV